MHRSGIGPFFERSCDILRRPPLRSQQTPATPVVVSSPSLRHFLTQGLLPLEVALGSASLCSCVALEECTYVFIYIVGTLHATSVLATSELLLLLPRGGGGRA